MRRWLGLCFEFPRYRTVRIAIVAAVVLVAPPVPSTRAQSAAGPEFRINSDTIGGQYAPAVAIDGSGNFIVVWQIFGQGTDANQGIFARRVDASGKPLGPDFQVNTYTTGAQRSPRVGADATGNFVIVWESGGSQDGSFYGVFGQRYDAAGTPQGPEFPVNSFTSNDQRRPAVACGGDAGCVAVWHSHSQGENSLGVFGQRYDAAGLPQGPEFRINTYSAGAQRNPAVAVDVLGNFVVVWESYQEGFLGSYGIFGQRYDGTGVPQGNEFHVNTYTTGSQLFPSVAIDASGNFVVAWQGPGLDSGFYGIVARRYDPVGNALSGEFLVNTYTTTRQRVPAVSSDDAGHFVVVWESDSQDGGGRGVFGQQFDEFGLAQGGEFLVNSYTTGYQRSPASARSAGGDFVVVWQSDGQDGSGAGIFAQRYGDLLFADGLESGDLTHWSTASTDGSDLTVNGAAALAGTAQGLSAFVNDINALFVRDDTPSGEPSYVARFYFDPNGFDTGEAANHFRTRVLIAHDQADRRAITIVLRRQAGVFSLQARLRLDTGARADTGFFSISDAPHFVEFEWQNSSGPGANDGMFVLKIDDVVRSTLTLLDTDLHAIEYVRMGAMSVKSGAGGTLYFDQFVSRRQQTIGPGPP